jgi:putative salt-induced outer membrane protein YdiY
MCARRLDRQWRSGSWVISPTLTFTQTVTCYSDQRNSSFLSASQMTTRLNGRLSARFWCQIDNENNPKLGHENSDTVTFVNPVYNSRPRVDRRLRHSQTVVTHGETTT